jgi:DNA-binding transcriptional ArsR family regulator
MHGSRAQILCKESVHKYSARMAHDDPAVPAPRTVAIDARQMRMMAHPLRLRLLGLLRSAGPATATTLAAKLATNTGATSYHLRQLAGVGLVEEAPDLGAGRQRFWRARHEVSSWRRSDFEDDPDARAAAQWVEAEQVRFQAEYAARWLAAQERYPRQWREAASLNDALLTLPPQRARQLADELYEVVMRYRRETPADAPDAEQVFVFLNLFPRVEEETSFRIEEQS